MSIAQPGQFRVSPMIGFGMELLMMRVVGVPFVSAAVSPGAHPGKPPDCCQTPEVLVQFPIGGGPLDVTVYTVGMQTAKIAVAAPASRIDRVTQKETKRVRRRRLGLGDMEVLTGCRWIG